MQTDAKALETLCKIFFMKLNSEQIARLCLLTKSSTLTLKGTQVIKVNKLKHLGSLLLNHKFGKIMSKFGAEGNSSLVSSQKKPVS